MVIHTVGASQESTVKQNFIYIYIPAVKRKNIYPTWKFTKKPAWLKEFKPTATVSQKEAIEGFLVAFKPRRDNPGPKKPIDCIYKHQEAT